MHKKVPGKMKFETGTTAISHFIGLRSKMYALKTVDQEEIKRAKGVSRCVTERELNYDQYHACLYNEEPREDTMKTIQSTCHQLYTTEVNKITLSPYDDKRYILANGIQSVPYGYCGPYPMDIDDY